MMQMTMPNKMLNAQSMGILVPTPTNFDREYNSDRRPIFNAFAEFRRGDSPKVRMAHVASTLMNSVRTGSTSSLIFANVTVSAMWSAGLKDVFCEVVGRVEGSKMFGVQKRECVQMGLRVCKAKSTFEESEIFGCRRPNKKL